MNYLAYPKKTTKHVEIWGIQIDMEGMRAIVLQDSPNPGTLAMTTVEDVAQVTAHAVDYEGKWPRIGGIRGEEMAMADILQLGEKIRGMCISLAFGESYEALTGSFFRQPIHCGEDSSEAGEGRKAHGIMVSTDRPLDGAGRDARLCGENFHCKKCLRNL